MINIDDILSIMARLRDPEHGCSWDLAQSFESIVPHTLEEAYEVADVIERGDLENLASELGDLLFQCVFYARLAEEQDLFNFADILTALHAKLIARHPHVFGDEERLDAAGQAEAWERIKAGERAKINGHSATSELDGVALPLPALSRALKLQQRAARVGFDWPTVDGAIEKVEEEIREVRDAIRQADNHDAVAEEVGDLIFASVNVARHFEIDAESALRQANRKFERRFRYIEAVLRERGIVLHDASLALMDNLWDEAKNRGM